VTWHELVADVEPVVFRVVSPRGSGSGFLLYQSTDKRVTAVATAAHVIQRAHFWEEPLRLTHHASGETVLLRADKRAVLIPENNLDVAAIVFDASLTTMPTIQGPSLVEKAKFVRQGVEIGWVGFPAIASQMCFFSGRVSAYDQATESYLVDGVAINGVSGGPAFRDGGEKAELLGLVTAYRINRQRGKALPGLAVLQDCDELHLMVEELNSFAEAKAKQTPPQETPVSESEPPAPREVPPKTNEP
jgi:hypothetical protein